MIPLRLEQIRLFLHVASAAVWVGGQIVLAFLTPVLRSLGHEAAGRAGRRFQLLAWPAFGVALATGGWNIAEVGLGDESASYIASLVLKLGLVAISGMAAAAHTFVAGPMVRAAATEQQRSRARMFSALTGALGLLAALLALFLGVQLRTR